MARKKAAEKVVKYQLGWTFPIVEERRMELAIKSANEFMETFGKGTSIPVIDKSKYCQNPQTEEEST